MKAKPETQLLPPSWPTVVIVVVIVLYLVHPDFGIEQSKAIESIVYLLAGSSVAVAGRRRPPVTEQGQ
ncbi:hypothetical protein [Streptacidiphilus melanogenes]|uniref:hypothetical protein n=1 Tax=Streptacidiphilus melanogenes TaxID=411235 RepID=UPI0005A95ACA|nr:hypothetical protein [Streptacidiphilus melanogenes]